MYKHATLRHNMPHLSQCVQVCKRILILESCGLKQLETFERAKKRHKIPFNNSINKGTKDNRYKSKILIKMELQHVIKIERRKLFV